eukprot:9483911-Pyramimonas_sp.AAC.2
MGCAWFGQLPEGCLGGMVHTCFGRPPEGCYPGSGTRSLVNYRKDASQVVVHTCFGRLPKGCYAGSGTRRRGLSPRWGAHGSVNYRKDATQIWYTHVLVDYLKDVTQVVVLVDPVRYHQCVLAAALLAAHVRGRLLGGDPHLQNSVQKTF